MNPEVRKNIYDLCLRLKTVGAKKEDTTLALEGYLLREGIYLDDANGTTTEYRGYLLGLLDEPWESDQQPVTL